MSSTPAISEKSATEPQRSSRILGASVGNYVRAWIGLPAQRWLANAALKIDGIRHWEKEFGNKSDAELLQLGRQLRGRARGGETLDNLLPETFGAVCVAIRRTLGYRPFDVQLAGGIILHRGGLTEVATGEGKTLVATLPTVLNALCGKGVHVATVNDYLARRDAEWNMPVYQALGLTVGILQQKAAEQARVDAYLCDITYGTASDFGFDFLRDQLKRQGTATQAAPFWSGWFDANRSAPAKGVQRGHFYALIDEADNVLIDEARTPLIIGSEPRPATPEEQVIYRWADRVAQQMESGRHFMLEDKTFRVELLDEGKRLARWSNPPVGPKSEAMDRLLEQLERAVQAHYRFRRDQHYMIDNDKIVIIDEYTGRRMPDRQWQDGLHQAVEVKEEVTITRGEPHIAQITFQSYFRLYKKRAGMTGTANPNARELQRVYHMRVVPVPTNRPVRREQWPDRIFPTEDAKFTAVVAEVVRLRDQGRPVLIGTRSVDKSENVSLRLRAEGVEHEVINARQHDREAEIVAQAGQPGKVTIATNMAGRGTDIKLAAGVAEAGGLHVLGTERHEARRIDRQLAGRAGRQGDPGSCQFFLSLEDELLEALGPETQEYLRELGQRGGESDWQRFLPYFESAQLGFERRHYRQRVDLMFHEKQRQEMLEQIGSDPYVD